MKITRPLLLLLFSGLLAAETTAPPARGEPLVLDPPLNQIFPLTAAAGAVRVQVPVLINEHTVLRPDDVLRFIYVDPEAGRGRSGGDDSFLKSHVGPGGTVYNDPETGSLSHGESTGAAGWGNNPTDDAAGIFDEDAKKSDAKRGKKELQNEVWTRTDIFDEALARANDIGTTLVYSRPSQARAESATIDLPEGMLLAQIDGHVRVLGLDPSSRAYQGGIRAGDEIRSIAGGAPLATLEDFVRAYIATKDHARITGNPGYAVEIWRPSEGQVMSIEVAAPPSIPSFL
jgi:hypothetical protein